MTEFDKQIGDYLSYCENTRGMTWQSIYSKRSSLTLFARVTGVRDVRELDNHHLPGLMAVAVFAQVFWRLAKARKKASMMSYSSNQPEAA